MSNELKVFENEEFGKVRTVEIDGEPWFVGKDVAELFGDTNYRRSILRLDDDEKGVSQIKTLGGLQNMTVINETGLYSLLFYMEPQKAKGVSQDEDAIQKRIEKLKKFKRWITHDVIPSIRRTGSYSLPQISYAESLRMLADKIEENERLKLEVVEMSDKISELQPKATYYDEILASKDTVLTTQIAKDYGMSAKTFNILLHDLGVQYKVGDQWVLYSKYQGMGYVHSKTHSYPKNDGSYGTRMQTEWRQAGRLFLYDLLKQHGILPLIERGN